MLMFHRALRGLLLLIVLASLVSASTPQVAPALALASGPQIKDEQATYRDEDVGFQLRYPQGWKAHLGIDRYDELQPFEIRRQLLVQRDETALTEFRVEVWENRAGLGLREWFEQFMGELYSEQATMRGAPDVQVAGQPALLVVDPAHEQTHGRISVFVRLGDAMVRVEYFTQDGGKFQQEFVDMVASISTLGDGLASASVMPDAPLLSADLVVIQVQSCCGWTDPNTNTYPCSGGNCTWWAKYKRPDVANTWGNAESWRGNAEQAGFSVGYKAEVGAIAVWQRNVCSGMGWCAGNDGHVAYVEALEGGGVFRVSSMSWGDGCHKGTNGVSTLRAKELGNRNLMFIYVANRPPPSPTLSQPSNGASVAGRSVTLRWNDPGDPDNRPNPYRDFYAEIWKSDQSWSTSMNWTVTTQWSVTVPSDGTYHWRVRAGDGQYGGDWSTTWSFSVSSQAAAPSNLRQTSQGAYDLRIAWNDNSSNESGFRIYKWVWDGNVWDFRYYATVGANVTTFTDTNLECATDYYYQVSAYNGSGESARSDWIVASTVACPLPEIPMLLMIYSVQRDSITIGWNDNSNNEAGFHIYRWGWQNGMLDFHYLSSMDANLTVFVDRDLACDTSYFYQVSAFNSHGETARTDWVEGRTLECPSSVPTSTVSATQPPKATATSVPTVTSVPSVTKVPTATSVPDQKKWRVLLPMTRKSTTHG